MVRQTRSSKQKKADSESPLPSDLEDEVDKFHKTRDKLHLNVHEDSLSDDEFSIDEDDAILDVAEPSDDDDDDEDDLDTDEEIEKETHFGKLARQAKALGAKLNIARGERDEDEDDDDDDDEQDARKGWGAGKRAYYDADVVDMEGSDEEDALKDEEEEALRLQRKAAAALRPEDFGKDSDSDSDPDSEEESSDDDAEPTMGAVVKKGASKNASKPTTKIIRLARNDDDDDTHAVHAAAVRQDALELKALIDELRNVLGEVRGRLGPLLREIRGGELATAEGVSYLEAKHTLLIHYAAAIVFYLLLKAEGRPVKDHPVVARLVEIRAYLEKIRPVDKRLRYQIEKLLAAAQRFGNADAAGEDADANTATNANTTADGDGALAYGPRPGSLLAPGGAAGRGAALHRDAMSEDVLDADGAYRPPRLNPVSMALDEKEIGRDMAKQKRKDDYAQRRAARSTFVEELAAELAGAPEEYRSGAAAPLGMDTAAALRERQRIASREAVEEELMVRVPLSRDERKRLKAQRRAGLSGKALLDDFADDVADLLAANNTDAATAAGYPLFSRSNQKFGADLAAQAAVEARRALRSGDDELPLRQSLSDRRAQMDGIRAKAQVLHYGDDDGDGGARKRKQNNSGGEEDDFYRSVKESAATKKKQRKESHHHDELLPPVEDPTTTSARKINTAIEKNRGLTPHRRKDMKNPRKKHRIKYQEATVRRKGQVQQVRTGEGGAYGGESTGIKSRVSKSVKF